jgi:hypothetical protein
VVDFFLYTKPITGILVYFAAQPKKAAAYAGAYCDNLVTINSAETCRNNVFPAFEKSAIAADMDPEKMDKMVEVQLHFSSEKVGVEQIKRAEEAGFLFEGSFSMSDPRQIAKLSQMVSNEKIANSWCFISSQMTLVILLKSIGEQEQHILN